MTKLSRRQRDAIKQYNAERDAAFENDNYEWARLQTLVETGRHVSAEVYVMAFHKARYICAAASEAKRLESQAWLIKHGCKYMGQLVKEGDALPS